MNSIERVIRALKGEDVDRVPLGFYLVDCDIIGKVIGRKTYVRDKVSSMILLSEGKRDELAESYKKDSVEFYQKVELCDIITHKEAAILPPKNYTPTPMKKLDDDHYQDSEGRVYQISRLTNDVVCVKDPVAESKEWKIEDFPEDPDVQPPDESIYEAFDYLISKLGDSRFILGPGFLGVMPLPGGMERGLMEYVARPELIHAINKHNLSAVKKNIDRGMIRPGQHGILHEEDYGTTRASILSPSMFRELCFPYMKEKVKLGKDRGQYVFLHSCGNTWDLIDMFIEAGFDAYQSLQTGAGMDLDKLYQRFDRKITFWGGIATEILLTGTPDEVRAHIRQAIEKAKRTKSILGPSHSIAYGTPYDNFMTMLDEFDKSAWYK